MIRGHSNMQNQIVREDIPIIDLERAFIFYAACKMNSGQ